MNNLAMISTKSIVGVLISAGLLFFPSLVTADEYVFSPKGSQYSVVFPSEPVITKYYTAEGDGCVTHNAILTMLDAAAGLRAEATVCSDPDSSGVNEDLILEGLRHHAETSGVSEAAFQTEHTDIGYMGSYRGILASVGNTFVYVSIIGEKSALALVGSAPYEDYPVIGFDTFIESVREAD